MEGEWGTGTPSWLPFPPLPSPEAQCKPYYSDYSRFRLLVHHLCTSHYLDLFITGVIGLNVVTMAMEHYQQPQVGPGSAEGGREEEREDSPSSRLGRGMKERRQVFLYPL